MQGDIQNELEFEVEEDNTLRLLNVAKHNRPTCSGSSAPLTSKKQKMKDDRCRIMKDVSCAMSKLTEAVATRQSQNQKETSNYYALGKFVESKMLQIDPSIADDIEEEIVKILFKGIQKSKDIKKNSDHIK